MPGFCDQFDFSSSPEQMGQEGCSPNVLETIGRFGALSTFVELIEIAGLAEIFLCNGPFTIFAPTNNAFAALDSETIEELSQPENQERLQNLLLYHIVPGQILADDFDTGSVPTLLENESLDISLGPLTIDMRVQVLQADNLACNGVVHIVDDVVVPGKCGVCMRN